MISEMNTLTRLKTRKFHDIAMQPIFFFKQILHLTNCLKSVLFDSLFYSILKDTKENIGCDDTNTEAALLRIHSAIDLDLTSSMLSE